MNVITRANYKEKRTIFPREKNTGELKVETSGYIPAKNQIETLIQAGMRLSEYRREAYDFGHGEPVDDNYVDPTRSPNFDLADAHELTVQVEKNIKTTNDENIRKKKEKDDKVLTDRIKSSILKEQEETKNGQKNDPDS